MKTIAEYLVNNHLYIPKNFEDLFVYNDKINKSNYVDYIKFRDAYFRKVVYIKSEDLFNSNINDIFKNLEILFFKDTNIVDVCVCVPILHTDKDFVSCCSVSLKDKSVNIHDLTNSNKPIQCDYDCVKNIINYFKNK